MLYYILTLDFYRFGRKKILVISSFGQFAAGFGTAWADSYPVYVGLRFFVTFFGIGAFLSAFVIGEAAVCCNNGDNHSDNHSNNSDNISSNTTNNSNHNNKHQVWGYKASATNRIHSQNKLNGRHQLPLLCLTFCKRGKTRHATNISIAVQWQHCL